MLRVGCEISVTLPPVSITELTVIRELPARVVDGSAIDLRQAWTALRRRRGFLFVAGGALAAAVAVNTLVFTIAYGVLFRPLPYCDPSRLVRIFEQSAPQPKFPLSIYNYLEDVRSNRNASRDRPLHS